MLLNSWEGLGFGINQTSLDTLASETADLGIKLFVNDDGWFGTAPYARINDTAGLGDWTPNPERFPNGLGPYVGTVDSFTVANSTDKLKFGIWVCYHSSELYDVRTLIYGTGGAGDGES